jgi:hypothetical protein
MFNIVAYSDAFKRSPNLSNVKIFDLGQELSKWQIYFSNCNLMEI